MTDFQSPNINGSAAENDRLTRQGRRTTSRCQEAIDKVAEMDDEPPTVSYESIAHEATESAGRLAQLRDFLHLERYSGRLSDDVIADLEDIHAGLRKVF